MTSEPLNQYTEICRDAIKSSSAKLSKTFESLLLEILLLYMTIQRKINFTQMERYGTHCEQTYRTNFNRGRAKCIDWVKFNLALCRRYLNMDGLLAIAIDPSYISKSGKKTPHIGTFWSGCASSMKHGLEIMGLALVDVHANSCMMLRAHQTPSTGELKMRNMTLVQHYIAVIKRYKKDLLKVTDIVVADAFFSIRPFVDDQKSAVSILSAASGILRAYIMCIRDLVPISLDVPRHLTEKSTTRNLTSHVWQSCILKDLKAQPTHS